MAVEDESWRARIELRENGVPADGQHVGSIANVRLYLENHPRLRGRLSMDAEGVTMDGHPLCDGHVREVQAIMMQEQINPSLKDVWRAVQIVALNRATSAREPA